MKISITELKKKKGKIEISNEKINNLSSNINQNEIELIVANAIQLRLKTGGSDE